MLISEIIMNNVINKNYYQILLKRKIVKNLAHKNITSNINKF